MDTRESLALELAQERHGADHASFLECGTSEWAGRDSDYLPDALAFVDRCIATAQPH